MAYNPSAETLRVVNEIIWRLWPIDAFLAGLEPPSEEPAEAGSRTTDKQDG